MHLYQLNLFIEGVEDCQLVIEGPVTPILKVIPEHLQASLDRVYVGRGDRKFIEVCIEDDLEFAIVRVDASEITGAVEFAGLEEKKVRSAKKGQVSPLQLTTSPSEKTSV